MNGDKCKIVNKNILKMLKSEYNNNQYREKKDPGEGEHERGNIEGKRNGKREKRKPEELEEVEEQVELVPLQRWNWSNCMGIIL